MLTVTSPAVPASSSVRKAAVYRSKKCSNFFQRQHVSLQTAVQKCWCGCGVIAENALRLENETDCLSLNHFSEAL